MNNYFLQHRRNLKLEASHKYKQKIAAKRLLGMRRPDVSYKTDPYDEVFTTITPENRKAKKAASTSKES